MRIRQHNLIFVGMALGAGLGVLLAGRTDGLAGHIVSFADFFGTDVFIGALKMIVAPLIFFSILAGIISLPTKGELWSIGWRTLLFYFVTTSIAVALGLLFVLTIRPGHQGDREGMRARWDAEQGGLSRQYAAREERIGEAKTKGAGETIRDNVRRVIMNPFQALSAANSLGIIFFAILLGIALMVVGEKGRPVLPVVEGVNAAIMTLTKWIMWAAPFFIFCLVTSLVAKQGAEVFRTLFWYVLTVLVAITCHVGMLLGIVWAVGRRSPLEFLRGIRRAWAVAFATRSSAATLPVTIDCVENELKVPRKVADFVLPIGATVNMDGTALYEGVAVIFLIQLFGGMEGAMIELSPVITVLVFLTAVLASIGAAAVPDAGLITMVLVANAVGLDPKYITLIFAVDAFLDMFRTSTNVMGDSVGAVVVARLEEARLKRGAAA
ncbi:MAG: dicarboxylate/amino acid:cation symporter [Planctomycetota bacterium]